MYKTIENYEKYSINEYGHVLNKKGKAIYVSTSNKGYLSVKLCSNGVEKKFSIHRLVALAFIPNPENKPFVNHIDGDKKNNHVSNLEWVTQSENDKHAFKIGLRNPKKQRGANNANTKLTVDQIHEIRNANGFTQTSLAKQFNVSRIQIQRILKRENWDWI